MQRVNVVGTSGSGKSTVARQIASRLGVPAVELDASWHEPGWTNPTESAFRRRIAALAAEDAWVIDGNYTVVRDIVWRRADTVVWLDVSRSAVMSQVTKRTLGRVLSGRRLWNGNAERLSNLVNRQPEDNIILWAWTTYGHNITKFETLMNDPTWEHLDWYRLQTSEEIAVFVNSVSRPSR